MPDIRRINKQYIFRNIRCFVNSSAFWIILSLAAFVILLSNFEKEQHIKVKREVRTYVGENYFKSQSNDETAEHRRSMINNYRSVKQNELKHTLLFNYTKTFEVKDEILKKEMQTLNNTVATKSQQKSQQVLELNQALKDARIQPIKEANSVFDPIKIKRKGRSTVKSNVTSGSVLKSTPTEVKHVAYLKVHKTGSSSTQNLFLRFGVSRNLTFLLASVKHNECGGFPNCISFTNTITYNNIMRPPVNRSFEILCSHVVYSRYRFRRYLPLDTQYIGIVREPVKRLESAINFFHVLGGTRLSTYANNPLHYNHPMLNNRMAFEFGFNQTWFPSTNKRTLTVSEKQKSSDYIKELDEDFTLIIVNERYHESLVLMKRLLKWKTQDILYSKKLKRKHKVFKSKDAIKLHSFLYLDYMLYNYAVEELNRKILLAGEDFLEEVGEFANLNKLVNMYCNALKRSLKPLRPLIVEATKWHSKFDVSWHFCNSLRRSELSFLDEIRYRQYGTLNTS